MKHVLVTGANGQLGRSIKKLENEFRNIAFTYTDVGELDITRMEELAGFFSDHPTDYVVNCAAYTAVDKAEEDPAGAKMVNAVAAENLATCAERYGYTLVHISTDYVFSGEKSTPYTEEDIPAPQSVYGQTKYDGEMAVWNGCSRGVILRTSWLYSEFGNNFLKTILRLGDERSSLKIVYDQVGTPTYATELARAILTLIVSGHNTRALFHFSNEGVASWYDFSYEIMALSQKKCRVYPIPTKDYPLPAKRPAYSLMSKQKFSAAFNYQIPHWKESLKDCLRIMQDMS